MDPNNDAYGWAADDPRWTDIEAAGRGRLEPPPPPVPRFGATEPDPFVDTVAGTPHAPWPGPPVPPTAPDWGAVPWSPGTAGPPPPALPVPIDPAPLPAVRFPIHTQLPAGLPRPGNATAVPSAELASRGRAVVNGSPVLGEGTRLDHRVHLRTRRRSDDEFRRAGRAELFSDDARYSVLLTLTATWYLPVALVFLAWVLIIGGGTTSARLLSGLIWLVAAMALSLAVVGLLRWASVGWRAVTLSIASALIGGGVATIAHTLSG